MGSSQTAARAAREPERCAPFQVGYYEDRPKDPTPAGVAGGSAELFGYLDAKPPTPPGASYSGDGVVLAELEPLGLLAEGGQVVNVARRPSRRC